MAVRTGRGPSASTAGRTGRIRKLGPDLIERASPWLKGVGAMGDSLANLHNGRADNPYNQNSVERLVTQRTLSIGTVGNLYAYDVVPGGRKTPTRPVPQPIRSHPRPVRHGHSGQVISETGRSSDAVRKLHVSFSSSRSRRSTTEKSEQPQLKPGEFHGP